MEWSGWAVHTSWVSSLSHRALSHVGSLSLCLLIFVSLGNGLEVADLETKRDLFESISGDSAKLTKIKQFSPPGNLPDLDAAGRKLWSQNHVSKWMDEEIERANLQQFFNGHKTAYDRSQPGVVIPWIGFPNLVETNPNYPTEKSKLKAAEKTRTVQDEYLEWSTLKKDDDIHRVVFTCEGPEYWEFLFSHQRDDAIRIVREMNAPYLDQAPKKDFFHVDPKNPKNENLWRYNPHNRYNNATSTGTITHLVQAANTLRAEIGLAAQASIIRKDKKHDPITDEQELIRCAGFGAPGRNSDPRIGSGINSLTRSGHSISIADPVALYIKNVDLSGLMLDPTGDQTNLIDIPKGTFKFTRGEFTKGLALRLQVQIPKGIKSPTGRQLYVSDIFDTKASEYIEYGGQLAKRITMGVRGVAISHVEPARAIRCGVYKQTSMEADDDARRTSSRLMRSG